MTLLSRLAGRFAPPRLADFARLPVVARQPADWQLAAQIRVSPADFRWHDPVSGVRCTKVTSENSPGRNTRASHDYAIPHISWMWGNGMHTLFFYAEGASAHYWIAEYERGVGVRRRTAIPQELQPIHDTALTPSANRETPTTFYVSRWRTIHKFEAIGGTIREIKSGRFPRTFSPAEVPDEDSGRLQVDLLQLQVDGSDRWFSMMSRAAGGPHSSVVLWDSQSNEVWRISPRAAGLRGDLGLQGGAVIMRGTHAHLGTDGDPAAQYGQQTAFWVDLATRQMSARYDAAVAYTGHGCVLWDGIATFDANSSSLDLLVHRAPAAAMRRAATPLAGGLFSRPPAGRTRLAQSWHMHAPWGVGTSPATRWVMPSDYGDIRCTLGPWREDGRLFTATVTDFGSPGYGRAAANVMSCVLVSRRELGYNVTLRRRATRAEIRGPWEWSFDATSNALTVSLLDGEPDERIALFATPSGVGLIQFVREDGAEARHAVHHMSMYRDWQDGYWSLPRACVSPDGSLVLWTSNMGRGRGRTDVYVADMPLAGETAPARR
jgi:hypothetical protein